MKGKVPVNVGASVRARLLKVSKERHEDFTLMLMNYAAERFLYRLSQSHRRNEFVLKGATLFAVRIGEPYRPTRDLDLLGTGEPSEAAIQAAVRDIVTTPADDDGVSFDLGTLQVHAIREDTATAAFAPSSRRTLPRRAFTLRSTSASATRSRRRRSTSPFRRCWSACRRRTCWRIRQKPSLPEKVEAMVDLGRSNSRMKDFADLAMAARRVAFAGDALVAAIRATFRRRQTPLPDGEIVALTKEFTGDEQALANWHAFAGRNQLRGFESLAQVVAELRPFLLPPLEHARTGESFTARWNPGGPWMVRSQAES